MPRYLFLIGLIFINFLLVDSTAVSESKNVIQSAHRLANGDFRIICFDGIKTWEETRSIRDISLKQVCQPKSEPLILSSGIYQNLAESCSVEAIMFYQRESLVKISIKPVREGCGIPAKKITLPCENGSCKSPNKAESKAESETLIEHMKANEFTIDSDASVNFRGIYRLVAPGSQNIIGDENVDFVFIPAGRFMMGSTATAPEALYEPLHPVEITKPFYIQTTPVTQKQWYGVMGSNHSRYRFCVKGKKSKDSMCPNQPVESINFEEISEFIQKLNEQSGMDHCSGQDTREGFLKAFNTFGCYRLPTEAEWEYAMRAGVQTNYPTGNKVPTSLDIQCEDRKTRRPAKVKTRGQPNAWGLYDYLGNVWEYVQDDYHLFSKGLTSASDTTKDPFYSANLKYRVIRGGSFKSNLKYCRYGKRSSYHFQGSDGTIGFRLSRSISL